VNVGESKIAVHNFIKSYGVNYPVVLDTDRQVLDANDVSPLPTTFLINPEGKVVKVVTGTMTESMIHDYINLIKPGETSG
ncbi:redoxin domain-containing protein, partial [Bacillus vallismortis]|nr:redoxin domain-containing protein [Bacillus vallismortis]